MSDKKNRVELGAMTNEALFCRSEHHAWSHKGDVGIVTNSLGFVVEFTRLTECARCEAKRSQKFEVPSFRIVKSSILYPEGYLHNEGRLYVAEVRHQQLSRMGLKIEPLTKEKK